VEQLFKNIEEQRKWNDPNMWSDDGHEWSKSFGNTENLWNKYIFDDIKEFRGKKILEIAPGYGRITQFLSILASELIVVDLNENCIDKCKEKLGHHVMSYLVNNGEDLPAFIDNTQDLVFSFDSFVHMHENVIDKYLSEIYRVLKPGGKAWIHHSWFYGGEKYSFLNFAGRSNMSPELFKSLVEKNDLEIIEQKPLKFNPLGSWSGTDMISIFQKKNLKTNLSVDIVSEQINPKIRVVHLLLDPNEPKDIPMSSWNSTIKKQEQSIYCWEKMRHKFFDYVQRYSIVNREELPVDSCKNPDVINGSMEIKYSSQELHYGHYGAYKAHVQGILENFTEDIDALIIAEGDSFTDLSPDEFYQKITESYNLSLKIDARLISYAGIFYMSVGDHVSKEIKHGDWTQVTHFLMGTTYMIMKSERENIFDLIYNTGWHSPDLWLAWNYCNKVPILASNERLVYQKEGYSLLDHNETIK
jgi:SAM-dependent methyltransferase